MTTHAELIARAEDLMRQRDVLSGLRVFSAARAEQYSEALDDLADLVPDIIAALRRAETGLALADVREAWGDQTIVSTPYNGGQWWCCYVGPEDRRFHHGRHATELDALRAARDAAPRVTTPTP